MSDDPAVGFGRFFFLILAIAKLKEVYRWNGKVCEKVVHKTSVAVLLIITVIEI